ncbi:MAG TPA: aromatic amino acid lyase, partial [Miltoncostaea sp.]|nr:aromatic amino acid lyase [Miltoncostaea sp.]
RPTADDVTAVALERASVALADDLLAAIDEGHAATLRALGAVGSVYGVTTGQGHFADRALSDDEAAVHQRNLLLGRAVVSPPWLDEGEARAVLAVRLARFCLGRAGVSAGLCRLLADRLNDGFTPAIPRTGIGCAGEVIPLAHAFQTLVGVGRVLAPDGVEDAAAALAARGAAPYAPRPKEGIALLAGSPGTLALAIVRARESAVLADRMLEAAACSLDASGVPLDAVSPAVAELAGDPVLDEVVGRLGALLDGAGGDRPPSQGPTSFRVVPQVLAHLARTIGRLREDAERALGGSDDSPALAGGRFVSTGAFHEIGLAAGMDAATAAIARTAETAAQRVHRMLDRRVTGLPDQLTPAPGPRAGLVVLHKRAVAAVAELRRRATPVSVGVADTSLGQEDVQSAGFAAAENLRAAAALAREVTAIELITARQAWWLRGADPAPGLRVGTAPLLASVPPVDDDRPLGDDVSRVMGLLHLR